LTGPEDGYEWAIARITELEVDLANAVSGIKRSQADNESLIANQADLEFHKGSGTAGSIYAYTYLI
jgi:hypothetical protein